jgi:transcriptional regulator with XRE-family HTH domain
MLTEKEKERTIDFTLFAVGEAAANVIRERGEESLTKAQMRELTNEVIGVMITSCLYDCRDRIPKGMNPKPDKDTKLKKFSDSDFPQRLREAMSRTGISQAELARRSGAHVSSLSHYIKGDWVPNNCTLQNVAAALGVSPEWLGFGVDTPPVPASAGAPHQSAALTASPRGSLGTEDKRKEVIQMNELDRFRMAAEELELGDRAAILISRTLGKLQTEVMKLGDDCPGGAHRIEALSGILAALAPVLEKLGTDTDQHRLRPRNDPAGETKEAAPVVATPGRQTKKAGT